MDERDKILEERRAFYEKHIKEILHKYLPEVKVVEVRQCWTPGWDARLDNGDVIHFDHVSYYSNRTWRRVVEYYFQSHSTRKKVIYERR